MGITKHHAGSLIVYLFVFVSLCVAMTNMSVKQYSPDFSANKPAFTIINRDEETPLTQGLKDYMCEHGTEVLLEDTKEALQDATFFHGSEYILIIPDGFNDTFFTDEPVNLQTVTSTSSADGYYLDSLANQYLNFVRVYKNAAPDMSLGDIADEVNDDLALTAAVEKKNFSKSQPVDEMVMVYNRMQAYIQLVIIILGVGTILITFQRSDLRMRNLCSPVHPRSIVLQRLLFSAVLSVIAWLALCVVGLAVYGSHFEGVDFRIITFILLNSFVYMIVCLAIALIVGTFAKSLNSQNAMANIFSLGLSFLGGVFVPIEMFSEGLITAAKFTPTYWYNFALNNIVNIVDWNMQSLEPVFTAYLFQLGFAAAFFCISLVAYKYTNGAESSFATVKTELEM